MTTEPLTVAEAARHLGVDVEDPGYSDLSAVITAARQTVEQYLNASVVVQARTWKRDAFPVFGLFLPNGPVLSITSVQYVDTDGATQTLSSSLYNLVNYDLEDYIEPVFGGSWPTTRTQRGAVTITYQAGMMAGSPLTLSKEDIKSAIKLTLGDLWANREGQFVAVAASVNPTVANLLHFHRRELGT